jgi:hypothetical protein
LAGAWFTLDSITLIKATFVISGNDKFALWLHRNLRLFDASIDVSANRTTPGLVGIGDHFGRGDEVFLAAPGSVGFDVAGGPSWPHVPWDFSSPQSTDLTYNCWRG